MLNCDIYYDSKLHINPSYFGLFGELIIRNLIWLCKIQLLSTTDYGLKQSTSGTASHVVHCLKEMHLFSHMWFGRIV